MRGSAMRVVWVLLLPQTAFAMQPSFVFPVSAWKATHVVVVNRSGAVVEAWKGDVELGTVMPVHEWNVPESQMVYYGHDTPLPKYEELPPNAVMRVTGERRLLFLTREGETDTWRPADLLGKHMHVSIVWLEREQAFAFRYLQIPGPLLIRPLHKTERELKVEVERLNKLQNDLRSASTEPDLKNRAERLVRFLHPRNRLAQVELFEELLNCGYAAWPVIDPLLLNETHLDVHGDLIRIATKVAGTEAIPTLQRVLAEEREYWAGVVASGQTPFEANPPMSHHYYRLLGTLRGLKHLGYRDPEGLVAKMRADWGRTPSLYHLGSGDKNRRGPIVECADDILARK